MMSAPSQAQPLMASTSSPALHLQPQERCCPPRQPVFRSPRSPAPLCQCSQATASPWQDTPALHGPLPGGHALAKQLKRFPVGGLRLHVHDGHGALGRPLRQNICLILLFSVWKSPHLLLKLLRLEKGEERNPDWEKKERKKYRWFGDYCPRACCHK